MTAKQPPRIATFILERLGPPNEALAGDLAEEYRAGRSVPWYWRQVLVTLALHVVADAKSHWLIALRGILAGLALLSVLGWMVALINAQLHEWLLRYPFGVIMMQFQFAFFMHASLWFPSSVVAGWVVARLHRPHRATAVIGLALALAVFALCNERLYFLIRNSLTHERFVPYLIGHLSGPLVGIAGVLLGGLMPPATPVNQRCKTGAGGRT